MHYLQGIERASRMKLTGLVNNTNLGPETTTQMIEESMPQALKLSELCDLPLLCTTAPDHLSKPDTGTCPLMQIPVLVQLPWVQV